MVREEYEHHIANMKRINGRILQPTLHSKQSHTPLNMVCAFALHSGKREIEQKQHWAEVRGKLKEIPNRHMIIWRTDANGQLGRQEHTEHGRCRIIGPKVKEDKTEAGNGQRLLNLCKQHHAIPMNTWHQPALTEEEEKCHQ